MLASLLKNIDFFDKRLLILLFGTVAILSVEMTPNYLQQSKCKFYAHSITLLNFFKRELQLLEDREREFAQKYRKKEKSII